MTSGRTEITHTVTSTDADYAGAAVSEVAVVVDDDDTATLALSVNPATLAENASTANVMVTATLTGAVLDAGLALPLVLRGTAQAGVDYEVSGTVPTITISEGNADAAASLRLTPVDDAIDEGNEMIAIGVAHARFGMAAPAAVELTDDDDAGLTLTLGPGGAGRGRRRDGRDGDGGAVERRHGGERGFDAAADPGRCRGEGRGLYGERDRVDHDHAGVCVGGDHAVH